MAMTRLQSAFRSLPVMGALRCRHFSSSSSNLDSEILEMKIIKHLYSEALSFPEKALVPPKVFPQEAASNKSLPAISIFHRSLDVIRPRSRPNSPYLSSLSEAALSQLASPSLPAAERELLLVSAALLTRSSQTLAPAVLSALAVSSEPTPTLRLLYVAGLLRLRLPAGLWRGVQQRLADHAATLSDPDLVALCSGSFRCGAAVNSGRLQQRVLSAARRLADAQETDCGPLVALLKALRLARVSWPPLLAALRRRVLKSGDHLPLPAAAHMAACWCTPPRRDPPLLAALEFTLHRRLETLLDPLATGGSTLHTTDVSTVAAVPDGRPKDVGRLLYTFAHLGHTPGDDTMELTERWMDGWSTRRPLLLVDALLSLAILGRYPVHLLQKVLTDDVALRLTDTGRPRQLARLALLRLAVSLEAPSHLAASAHPPLPTRAAAALPPPPCVTHELRRRPRLAELLERLRRSHPAARAALGHPVPHVNTASVLLSWPDGRRVAVEMLDTHTALIDADDDVTERGGGISESGVGITERGSDVNYRYVDDTDRTGDVIDVDVHVTGRSDAISLGDITDKSSSDIRGSSGGSPAMGPESAVGLLRLKARLAQRLGYDVWWESGA